MPTRKLAANFGAPADVLARQSHLFRVEIPAALEKSVTVVEDDSYQSAAEGGRPRSEVRVSLPQPIWAAIADSAEAAFNAQLKAAGAPAGRWQTGANLLDRLLGRELCVLAWAAETAGEAQLPVICRRWAALRPEERWWLYTITAAEAGRPGDTQRGWRRALFCALADAAGPDVSRKEAHA